MPGSIIKAIKSFKCGWDGKELQAHSHKGLMKCLYKSNVDLFRASQTVGEKDKEINNLQAELARFIVREQTAKEDTGLMDVTDPLDEIINAPPLKTTKDLTKNDKELAKDLLEAESVIDVGNAK